MSRVVVTGGPGLVGSSVILRLLAAGREVRTKVESPMRAAAVRAMVGPRKVQPGPSGSFSRQIVTTTRDGWTSSPAASFSMIASGYESDPSSWS